MIFDYSLAAVVSVGLLFYLTYALLRTRADTITLDVKARRLDVQANLDERRAQWKPPAPKYKSGVMAKYAKLVSSASEGAVTNA